MFQIDAEKRVCELNKHSEYSSCTIIIQYYQIVQKTLQLIQNAAMRVLTGTRKTEHISPILASLRWIPVKSRI